MQVVRIMRDMRPWREGQDAVVSDMLAQQLIQSGAAMNARPYPPPDVAPAVPVKAPEPQKKRPILHRPRPYVTRKAR